MAVVALSKETCSPHCHLLLEDFPAQLTGWVPQRDPEGNYWGATGEKDMWPVQFCVSLLTLTRISGLTVGKALDECLISIAQTSGQKYNFQFR